MLRYPCEPDARLHAAHRWRAGRETQLIKNCEICGSEFVAKRSTAKYCSNKCRLMSQRGMPYTGEISSPDVRVSMSEDEIVAVVARAHDTASDLSRASMLTPAPLCRSLKTVSKKLSDALRTEGL